LVATSRGHAQLAGPPLIGAKRLGPALRWKLEHATGAEARRGLRH
jgi:hypothetical protein